MAINRVFDKPPHSVNGLSQAASYVIKDTKIDKEYVTFIGPYKDEEITPAGVVEAFMNVKKAWDRTDGVMCKHSCISFHEQEKVSLRQIMDIAKEFVKRCFEGFQSLIAIHMDKNHPHVHILTNSVSYLDGHKYHQSREDLEKMRAVTNKLCRERGLTVAEKGHHFDGREIEAGHIEAWTKDKYRVLLSDDSYVKDCAKAVTLSMKDGAKSKDEFERGLEDRGWTVEWKEKGAIYSNRAGERVSATNIEKTFHIEASEEHLENEFIRRTRDREKEPERTNRQYYETLTGTDYAAEYYRSSKEETELYGTTAEEMHFDNSTFESNIRTAGRGQREIEADGSELEREDTASVERESKAEKRKDHHREEYEYDER